MRFISKLSLNATKIYYSQTSERIEKIVNEISLLNLNELSILIKSFKDRFSLSDSFPILQTTNAVSNIEDSSAAAAPEKTDFSVFLKAFEAASKAKVIKEIKQILPNLNLVDAKAFVESAPKLIKDKIKKDEAENLKKKLEAVGATVSIE